MKLTRTVSSRIYCVDVISWDAVGSVLARFLATPTRFAQETMPAAVYLLTAVKDGDELSMQRHATSLVAGDLVSYLNDNRENSGGSFTPVSRALIFALPSRTSSTLTSTVAYIQALLSYDASHFEKRRSLYATITKTILFTVEYSSCASSFC